MKNPYVFWTLLAASAIAGFFLGNSDWAKNQIAKWFSLNPTDDGSPCNTSDNKAGHFVSGKCVADPAGDMPVDPNTNERTSNARTADINTQKTALVNQIYNLANKIVTGKKLGIRGFSSGELQKINSLTITQLQQGVNSLTNPTPPKGTGGGGAVQFYVCSDGTMGFGASCEDCPAGETCWRDYQPHG